MWGVLFCARELFLRREFLDGGVQAGLAPGGIVLLDDILLSAFVECLLRLLEPFLGEGRVGLGDRFARTLHGAFDDTLDGTVAERILRFDPHLLLGGLLDRNSAK